jgi:pimeloyl-ACP methyl ester carboxylesterase
MDGENAMDQYDAFNIAEVNGVQLHYAVVGEGRPIVLVHGNAEDHNLFTVEIEQLAEAGYRVYAPDSRGHGANEPLEEYHFDDMAEDMYQFIRAMGLEKPALYGHSDGGIIGLLLEINHPGTLGILAVSGTNLVPEGVDPSFLEEYWEAYEEEHDPLIGLMLTEPHIEEDQLRSITIPVLVTAGEYDLILPEETYRIAEALPDAELVIMEGEDHGSYIEDSDIMGEMLLDFFERRWE